MRDLGGLMAYAPNYDAMWKLAATWAHRILTGARPSRLPIGQPTEYEFIINGPAAAAIGLAIPDTIRSRAKVLP